MTTCIILHLHTNGKSDYKIQNAVINTTAKEKDIGVTIQADLKVSEQCGVAASKRKSTTGND